MKLNLDEYVMEHNKEVKIKGEFINRELSWLDFNERVLRCAINKEIPLNERLKFLAISCNNLDEFISVRFAYVCSNKEKEPYKKILDKIKSFFEKQSEVYDHLREEIKKKGVNITKISKLDKKDVRKIHSIFMKNVFPMLTPIYIGNSNDSPNLYSGQSCIACIIRQGDVDSLAIIPISKSVSPIYNVGNNVIMVEDMIETFLHSLFINKKIIEYGCFRIIKDASVILDHDPNKYILERMNETLIKRKLAKPLFLETNKYTSKELKDMILAAFEIPKNHFYQNGVLMDYTRFMSNQLLSDKYSYSEFTPAPFQSENMYSLFTMISEKDILLHHPYDSYETVVKFIEHAAIDPNVIGIKQTLYRVSSIDSPIVNALCLAAKNGKHVAVLVEIKARFDEENNIRLITKLKNAGCHVLLGLEYLKTHCKMCIVLRQENKKVKIYSHVATGNYNEKTSRIYTDLSYFTAKQKIGMDLLNVFNILSGISTPDEKMQKISYSPVTLRKTLIKCIDREIDNAKKKKDAEIFLKLNSISDRIMVDKLYEAADKGVRVYIICRGICSIVPRKNIYVKSIVGRFLEHSRIYYFKNNGNPDYFISSADLLTRNLDRRVEIMISLKDSNVTNKLKEIIKVFKEDKINSFEMDGKGKYHRVKGNFNAHEWFIKASKDNLKLKSKKGK